MSVFPAAKVTFQTSEGEALTFFLIVDSGATVSALPKSDGEMFGVKVEQGIPETLTGINGVPLHGWRHTLAIKLDAMSLRVPFVFLEGEDVPRVLGRGGIFDRFTIVFEEGQKRTGFIDEERAAATAIRSVLDSITPS